MKASSEPALVIIDVQQGMDDPRFGERCNPDAEQRIADLLAAWRAAGRPVIHVQHASLEPGSNFREDNPGHALKKEVLPIEGEPLFKKNVSSAFIGTDLERYLRDRGITELVMVGMTTEHCVSTTARMGGNLGFNVTVVADATATFERTGYDGKHYSAEVLHGAELASLDREFAAIRESKDILAEVESSLPVTSS
ncbi:MAG TPA: cysteine hydrolase family protein [Gemmatimonadaceae bacterium]|nr:cysteine hydrolase family protein [Gemmatimonadaceae bacterium]